MSEWGKRLEELRNRPADKSKQASGLEAEVNPSSAVKAVPPPGDLVRPQPPTQQLPPQEWKALIQGVQAVARRSREMEIQAHEQETRVGQVLEEVREDINAANQRARDAEANAREVQARAEAQILAAEERAKAAEARAQEAEERAQHAEGWLACVQETILSEFTDLTLQAAA